MSRADNETRIKPSILDRLLDLDPKNSSEATKSRSQSILELKAAVGRDLEWLLNTRRLSFELTDGLVEVNKSVIAYGIPELSSLSPDSILDRELLMKEIESAIARFEPRFLSVKVTLEPLGGTERSVRFRVDAVLDVDPVPEAVSFDTLLGSGNGHFQVAAV